MTRSGVVTNRWVEVSYAGANPVRRAMRRLAASGPGSRVFAPLLHRLDRPVYRLTRGRTTLGGLVSGLPVGLVTTTGARSGRPRTVPLLVLPSSEGMAVIASNWGRPGPPAWERNLRAHPTATFSMFGTSFSGRVVEAQGERRARIWREALDIYPGYAAYARRAGARPIGVYVLDDDQDGIDEDARPGV
jgi:deazaflavin-dependent oxidoreductase (nitroreductase family)